MSGIKCHRKSPSKGALAIISPLCESRIALMKEISHILASIASRLRARASTEHLLPHGASRFQRPLTPIPQRAP
eukprot:6173869-Pleurochrysis_carterae.AAC.3